MAGQPKYDEEKLKKLIVYISAKHDETEKFNMTKLNKLLFFSDFAAYARTGKPITGAKYIKMPFGPCPETMGGAVEALERESRVFTQRLIGKYDGKRLRPVFDYDLTGITGDEVAIVDEVIERYWKYTGSEISDASHGFIGWRLATDREEIPYVAVMIPDRPLTPSTADLAEAYRRAAILFG